MKELNFNELTTAQKIGMTLVGCLSRDSVNEETFDTELEYLLELIRNHSLGGVWVSKNIVRFAEAMEAIRRTADYPILIITDAEGGIDEYEIGRLNSLGVAGREDLAYTFGKVVAAKAREQGYNVICAPVVEIQRGCGVCGKNTRALGSDKEKVASLAVKIAEGMHAAGVLSVAKHYPSSHNTYNIDSHMAEAYSEDDLDTVMNVNLYPYFELLKRGLLDGIMTQHFRLASVDNDRPASLSKKVINLIRDRGFDGLAITDGMCMMGVVAKYGWSESKGMAIEAGNDLMLPWYGNRESVAALTECYEKGIVSDESLNRAVRHVLEAQHKTLAVPEYDKITEEDVLEFNKINTDSIYEYIDDGVSSQLSSTGRHYFVLTLDNNINILEDGKVDIATFDNSWYYPEKIAQRLKELFPNSDVGFISEFPSARQTENLLVKSVDYDDIIFLTHADTGAYIGRECLTSRIVSIIEALQITSRVSTLLHFGNPYVLEELPHIPRIIVGCLSKENVNSALDVMAGLYPAKGVPTYDITLK